LPNRHAPRQKFTHFPLDFVKYSHQGGHGANPVYERDNGSEQDLKRKHSTLAEQID